jgi:hypothetical protein
VFGGDFFYRTYDLRIEWRWSRQRPFLCRQTRNLQAQSRHGPFQSAPRAPAPKPVNKRVWASVQKTVAEVLDEAFAEAKRRDLQGERTWVMLVDGQEEQLRQVYAAIERHEADVIVIQDFIHVLEYLWQAAWCLHKEGDPAAEQWVQRHAIDILLGKSSDVAAGMRRSATRRDLSQSERAPLDKCAEYLLKNRERLDYAQALRGGLPIATGVVEGACRHLVKQRMECSGARWSLQGAEAVLQLRALRMSGDWDGYFAFHKTQERLRNYPEWPEQRRLAAPGSPHAGRGHSICLTGTPERASVSSVPL